MKTFSMRPAASERLEKSSCPVCGSNLTRPRWDLGDFVFSACASCGHVYQNPRPRPEELAARYDEDYLEYEVRNAEPYLRLMLLGLADLGFGKIEAALPADRSFLDVGCATGALLELLSRRGWSAEGVELCGPAAEYGRRVRGVSIRTGTLAEAAFPENGFDFAHSSHVIEHVADPGALFAELHRVLKPGGYYAVVTPNLSSLQALLFRDGWRSAIADHMHLFSRGGLIRMLGAAGFQPVRTVTWGGLAQGLAPRPVKALLDRSAKALGFGDVMAVLARKPAVREG